MARVSPPQLVRLEASTACQLRCPMWPTATGEVGKGLGTGFLKFTNFKKFIDEHPDVCDIELSNYGEIFLNNELLQIIEYAYTQGVHLYCENGANLNDVRDDVLEALVRLRFRYLNCSIDGATNEIYSIDRKRDNLNIVLSNIRKINRPALPVVSRRSERLSLTCKRLVPASTKRRIPRVVHLFHGNPSTLGSEQTHQRKG